MTKDINNFITIIKQKNGKCRVTHNDCNEANIYIFLHEQGFGFSKINNKRIYFRRESKRLTIIHPFEIKDAFLSFLEQKEYTDLPKCVSHHDVMEWFYSKRPIKQNGLYIRYLEEVPSEELNELLRLKSDEN